MTLKKQKKPQQSMPYYCFCESMYFVFQSALVIFFLKSFFLLFVNSPPHQAILSLLQSKRQSNTPQNLSS